MRTLAIFAATLFVVGAILAALAETGVFSPNFSELRKRNDNRPEPRICTRQQAARGECQRADDVRVVCQPGYRRPDGTCSPTEIVSPPAPPTQIHPNQFVCDKREYIIYGLTPLHVNSNCTLIYRILEGCVFFVHLHGAQSQACAGGFINPDHWFSEIRSADGNPFKLRIMGCPYGSRGIKDEFRCTQ